MEQGRWLRRGAKGLALAAMAAVAGLTGARMLGPIDIHAWGGVTGADASTNVMERYRLGRDLAADAQANPRVAYTPYEPGARAIARPTVAGARVLEPYEPARTREWKARRSDRIASTMDEALAGQGGEWTEVAVEEPDPDRIAAEAEQAARQDRRRARAEIRAARQRWRDGAPDGEWSSGYDDPPPPPRRQARRDEMPADFDGLLEH